MSRKRYRVVRIPKDEIPKELLEIRPTETSGATLSCDFSVWPDWEKRSRDPKTDLILYCPIEEFDLGSKEEDETPVSRLTVIRKDEKDAAKGYPFNKDIYILNKDEKDDIVQKELRSEKKRDHWMKRILSEYLGWPVIISNRKRETKRSV